MTDEDVSDCFLHKVEHLNGALQQYLQHADVVAVVGHTLFAHDTMDANTMQFVQSHNHLIKNQPSAIWVILAKKLKVFRVFPEEASPPARDKRIPYFFVFDFWLGFLLNSEIFVT